MNKQIVVSIILWLAIFSSNYSSGGEGRENLATRTFNSLNSPLFKCVVQKMARPGTSKEENFVACVQREKDANLIYGGKKVRAYDGRRYFYDGMVEYIGMPDGATKKSSFWVMLQDPNHRLREKDEIQIKLVLPTRDSK